MRNVYACPVHVDRQSADLRQPCPLCGQPLILLRSAPVSAPAAPAGVQRSGAGETRPDDRGERPGEPAERPTDASADQAELARELDRAIKLLTRIRNRLRTSA